MRSSSLQMTICLEEKVELPAFYFAGMNRRQMVRVLGLGAIIAVPLVTTIVAPTPQLPRQFPPGSACCTGAQCTSTICNGAGQVVLQLVYVPSAGLNCSLFSEVEGNLKLS